MTPDADALRCDVFCRVVDNYGDAAVCWRLARSLAGEQGFRVRLWIDRMEVLAALQPALDPRLDVQRLDAVQVHRSPPSAEEADLPDIAIDAFGGGLPDGYASALAARRPRALWIVLEYLTAERWAADVHRLASPHPALDIRRRFFCPGFDPGTGGLLREQGLLEARAAFEADGYEQARFRQRLGLPRLDGQAALVSLFGYANPGLHDLLAAMAAGPRPVVLAVAPGPLADGVAEWFATGGVRSTAGAASAGMLQVRTLPFLSQPDYDRLLWSADLNFVRGEDSLVRGLWAAQPLCWQLYPQQDDAQCPKLQAFIDVCDRLYGSVATNDVGERAAAVALAALQHAWNGCRVAPAARGQRVAAAWPAVLAGLPALHRRASALATSLGGQPDLAARLAGFCREQLK
ncbi:MAG: elongation factor P maturation arginine rhamnosyltransferase EarP [Rhodocyclaceae bacterium]|nr:elongation factor P maturation arginine rhamnosyltransferase EarP [Rhodocyclaceae bacterium]MCE2979985.1 elongation factor P maturation arginine rhamnosyltransferase EarP [Betaproteobacteria bacterium]MCA3075627.1 elongation factor P maturation arginine rhamnosyltransferase EarP [Rhodocyclaceae bacterium]MCA3089431.1 elongation factor P maturation arginine rhamnosyltransferase EarP [Rhodocyclaceae bacterium]MCA3092992.1 elongation factor P maturation arginine rhamnosyltransferase EarP [Rhodo